VKKAILTLLISIVTCLIVTIPGIVHSTNKPVLVVVDGTAVNIPFIVEKGTTYVSLRSLVNTLGGSLDYNSQNQQIEIKSKHKQTFVIDMKRSRILKEGLWRNIPLLTREGHTYFPLKPIAEIFGRKVEWDQEKREVHIFHKLRLESGKSIAKMISFHGLSIEGDKVTYRHNESVLSMYIGGKIKDITYLGETKIGTMSEKKYGIFWQQEKQRTAHILFTIRETQDGEKIFFAEGYSPGKAKLEIDLNLPNEEAEAQYYLGNLFLYEDRGDMKELHEVLPAKLSYSEELRAGKSFDWFIFQSNESLKFTQTTHIEGWNSSKTKHRSIWWLTPIGANRSVPEPYLTEWENGLYFINLQASTPQLIMDIYKQNPHPLYKIALENAAFTLMKTQGKDGFWRTEPNVAYLNRAFGLGERFIDTRMSADASIFLLDYYEWFGVEEALDKAEKFTHYFSLNDQKNHFYDLGNGRLYPDYYSEIQHSKPLVSLNHVLHEINYLLLLQNQVDQPEPNKHIKLMLEGIKHSKNKWISNTGDLFYALNNKGQYYATDYIFITYRDLLVTKSLLLRENLYYPEIDQLLKTKHDFLQKGKWTHYETDLSFERVYYTFDLNTFNMGSLFLSTPIDLGHNESVQHYAVGAFHWVKGINRLNWGYHHIELDEFQKYIMLDLKNQFVIVNNPIKDIFLNEKGQRVIVNGDQVNTMIVMDGRTKEVITLEPNSMYDLSEALQ